MAVAVYMVYGALTQVEFREVLSGQGTHVWKDANANGIVDFKDEAEFILQSNGNYLRENVFSGLGKVHWT
ncbi:MAG: hypothetical protein ACK55I_01010, partial [bacterium]